MKGIYTVDVVRVRKTPTKISNPTYYVVAESVTEAYNKVKLHAESRGFLINQVNDFCPDSIIESIGTPDVRKSIYSVRYKYVDDKDQGSDNTKAIMIIAPSLSDVISKYDVDGNLSGVWGVIGEDDIVIE